ncbi:MAG: LysR family glycine cleavage system transcriptional activator [Gammaproteobacteria bacterium]|jgi:LysR family glycine cleavage system transcriptional activator
MHTQYRNLRTFCITAELLSFKHTADQLCLTASAISHQIKELESFYDVKLFVRGTRVIYLTPEGKTLYDDIKLHFCAIDKATTSLKTQKTRSTLFVQMPEFFASELFLPRIAEFSESNKDIDLHLDTLASGEKISPNADIGIILTSRSVDGQSSRHIFPIHYVPACSPELYNQLAPIDFDNFMPDRILLHKARPLAWKMWAQNAGLKTIPTSQIMLLASMFSLVKAAEEGLGIALIPMPLSQSRFDKGTLVPLFKNVLQTQDYYNVISQPNDSNERASRALWQWIIQTFSTNT